MERGETFSDPCRYRTYTYVLSYLASTCYGFLFRYTLRRVALVSFRFLA